MTDFTWESWTLEEVARRLSGVDVPWAFAAGWALELYRGAITREHEDVEIVVPAACFGSIRAAFAPFEFDVIGAGFRWPLSDQRAFRVVHQTWLRDPDTGVYRLDVFREPHDGDTWIFRRDTSLRRPYSEVLRRSTTGLPYVAPELVLRYKARLMRPKDETDFDGTSPLLDPDARSWLRSALEQVHPGHAWLAKLE